MKRKRLHYILFSCDQWKSHSSKSLIGVFTAKELIRISKRKVKNGDFEFGQDIKEIEAMSVQDINTALTYGHIEECQINEILE